MSDAARHQGQRTTNGKPSAAHVERSDHDQQAGPSTQGARGVCGGGPRLYREGEHTSTLQDPVITQIAEAHGKTPAQVLLRWGLQHGRSVIPKSTKPHRIAENIDVFDFELTTDEVSAIDVLDTGRRGGPEPEAITLEAFGRPIPEA